MSTSGNHAPGAGRKRPRFLFLLLFGVLAAAGIWLGSRAVAPFAEKAIAREAASRGIQLRPQVSTIGLTGGVLSEVEAVARGIHLETGEIRLRWHPLEVVGGSVEAIEIDGLEADVDLAAWIPPGPGADETAAPAPRPGLDRVEPEQLPAVVGAGPFPSGAARSSSSRPASGPAAVRGPAVPELPLSPALPELPFAHLLLGSSSVDLRFGERALRLHGGLEYAREAAAAAVQFRFGSSGFLAHGEGTFAAAGGWSLQAAWQGAHPLAVWRDLLPSGHPWHPAVLAGLGGADWRLGDLSVQGLAEGAGRELERLSLFLDHGPLRLSWGPDRSVLLRAASAGVTLEEGAWKQAEAVFEFDETRYGKVRTEGFQSQLSWSPEEPGRIEIPQLRLSAGDRVSAELALRGFLAPDRGAELQLAFQSLLLAEQSLHPFRWFLHERAGVLQARLSELRTANHPQWQLSGTRFTVNNLPGRSAGPETWSLEGRTELEFRPEVRTMATATFEAKPRPDAAPIDFAVRVQGELEETLASVEGFATREGDFRLAAHAEWALADTLPYLFPLFPGLAQWRAGGRLDWRLEASSAPLLVEATARTALEGAELRWAEKDLEVDGIEGDLRWRVQGPFIASAGEQEIRIASLSLGEEAVRDLTIRFRLLHRQALRVLSCEGEWMGGRVTLDPFTVDPSAPSFETTLRMQGIEAARLFPDPDRIGFLIDSKLSGAVPFSYTPETGPKIVNGLLEAVDPGDAVLRVTDPEAVARFLPLPDTFALKTKVLEAIREDFRFRSLRIELFDPATPLEPIVIEFEGGVKTSEIEMESVHVKVPQRFDRALKGWESLLVLLSGGTLGL